MTITEISYHKKRLLGIKNLSKNKLNWGLSDKKDEFSYPFHIVNGKSKSRKLSKTLAPIGNFLLINNPNNEPAKLQIWVGEVNQK